MTQVITRYFDSAKRAYDAKQILVRVHRFSSRIIDIHESAEGLIEALTRKNVAEATAQAYQDRMANGGSVMLVLAGYKPLQVAQITRDVTAQFGAADLGPLIEEVYVKDKPTLGVSILNDHPHFLTKRREPGNTTYHMADWPIPLINRRKPYSGSLFEPHARMASLPIPLISRRKPFTGSILAPHARMAAFPLPLISRRKPYTGSVIAPHARMAAFPLPLISRRKPFTGSVIPRHGRMASVPIPLLINGKIGSAALIPGAPRMANFPIPLLSGRKPYTGSIFERHARMANFPLGLISRRKPFTGSIIPRHGRMADIILPLVIRRADTASNSGGSGFSFSKMLGLPTLTPKWSAGKSSQRTANR